ncbi:ABC-F family ATP-binding cassette domain-containing protein [Protaetiibacter larvae]|uniref:ABC-F family ATP-binding cassette domain-containing protein n=1 Tax=Protaetiibacter larvae TaxID=2592654 RepID=A0A5C1Y763_9MICO|nr:ABC-F family ATP-binding cassette domain-containing protein [Protaetiibacter larvae]QEO09490.1 ABC-F family ATP-binding cassette domain-containing protein [Protaetiibacter larvae]
MAHLLGAESISLSYPTKDVFDDVTVGLSDGDRIGVVGRNGDGKSTLLRILAGRTTPDAGRVTRRGGVTVGMLDQSDTLPEDERVGHAIVGDRAEHEWAGDAKVRDVIRGLVRDIPWDARIGELSGGQRRRVALAALLSHDWDVLFLDEPTNHLDIEGVAWLAAHLKTRWPANQGALVAVTHDRWFLDEVSTDTWEVHDRIIEPFEGGYAAYILQRVERDRMAAATESKRQNLLRKELAWLRRGAPARTSKPKFRIDAANELISDVPPVRDRVALEKLAVSRLGKDVVDLLDVSVAFPDGAGGERQVLRDIEWRIAPGERTGILGVNGAGKSTLLGLVAGTVAPTSGRVKQGKTVRIAVLDQRLAELDDIAQDRVAEVIGRQRASYRVGGGAELTPGQLLERLGFTSAQLSTPVKDLSGGQKRRLQLLLILLDEPNVLILDEPTNDLDTDMLAAMEDLLDSWPGTLLVVSHDRYLLERVTDQQYAVLDGRLRHLPGGVEEYLRLSTAESAGFDTPPPAATQPASGAPGLTGAERRTAEKELAAVERRMARVADAITAQHDAFASADPFDYAGLQALQQQLAELESEQRHLETRWLELSELLE